MCPANVYRIILVLVLSFVNVSDQTVLPSAYLNEESKTNSALPEYNGAMQGSLGTTAGTVGETQGNANSVSSDDAFLLQNPPQPPSETQPFLQTPQRTYPNQQQSQQSLPQIVNGQEQSMQGQVPQQLPQDVYPQETKQSSLSQPPSTEQVNETSASESNDTSVNMDISTYSSSNDTQPSNVTTSSTETSSVSTTDETSTEKPGIDDKDGHYDSLADFAIGLLKDGKPATSKPAKSENKTIQATTDTTIRNNNVDYNVVSVSNCNAPIGLGACQIPEIYQPFFNYDLSLQGVIESILYPELVQKLSEQCQDGTWCLDYSEHKLLKAEKASFYQEAPVCMGEVRTCLQNIRNERKDCDDKELDFLMSSLETLCGLNNYSEPTELCYARSLETLYVTYVHMFTKTPKPVEEFCESYPAKLTKLYLCADDACTFDQNVVLEHFKPWTSIAENASEVATLCNISTDCPYEYEEAAEEEEELDDLFDQMFGTGASNQDYAYQDDYYDYDDEETEEGEADASEDEVESDEESFDIEDESEETQTVNSILPIAEIPLNNSAGETASIGEGEIDASDKIRGRDELQNFYTGVIVMVVLATLILVGVSVVVYRRIRVSRVANYRRGYSRLTEEERAMLKHEYN